MTIKPFVRACFVLFIVLSMLLSLALYGPGREARAAGTGSISGTVTGSEAGNPPLASIVVRAYDYSTGALISSVTTNAQGIYAIGSLAAGDYKVKFEGNNYHLAEYYDDKKNLVDGSLRQCCRA